jgi:A/G-specific adenine glycosylase
MPADATPDMARSDLAHIDITGPLLGWYDRHARRLPWRAPPGTPAPDPYRIWLSEIMLQQTTVAAVIAYFERFMKRWPTVTALAAADEGAVMAAWAGLGYYARARNLIACARMVAAAGGAFPDSEDRLRTLPGIGAYTAAAIAAIAFGRRAVVVDGNVERVVARLFAVDVPLPAAKPLLRDHADRITPDRRPGDFAQAMMDLGATICTPRNPACTICPLHGLCPTRSDVRPLKTPKRAKPRRHGIAHWIERDGAVWLVRRPPRGLLGAMLALPSSEWTETPVPDAPAIGTVEHIFTHFALTLHVIRQDAADDGDGLWWPIASLAEAGLPTVFAKAAALAQKARLQEDASA